MYPHGPQVLKQLVSRRNTQKNRADTLTAQTPSWKKRKKLSIWRILKESKGPFVSGIVCTAQICVFWLLPMANCAAVQLSLSASRWSSLILMSCLRPSSLFTRSFSHWYPFKCRKRRKWRKTLLRLSHRRRTITPKPIWSGINPWGELVKSNWPSSPLWSTPVLHRCTCLWLIHKQVATRSWLRPLKDSNDDTHVD